MKGSVSLDRSIIFWTHLMAVAFVASAPLLHADDQARTPDGYRIVPVNIGGRTVPIKVKDSDPFKNVSSPNTSGHYNPEHIFSTSSSMADKKFDFPSESASQTSSSHSHDTFVTKVYADDEAAPVAPGLHTKAVFPTANAAPTDTDFTKSYFTTSANQAHAAALGNTTASADQHRSAALGGPEKQEVLAANDMGNKQYLGPGAQHVPAQVAIPENVVLTRIQDVPNRSLSIDEVRNLINHGFKPNTDVKPEESSKPLNDPNYKPEPLRDSPTPAPTPVSDDDKNDAVPPPGTMAAPHPENSEPLPQP